MEMLVILKTLRRDKREIVCSLYKSRIIWKDWRMNLPTIQLQTAYSY